MLPFCLPPDLAAGAAAALEAATLAALAFALRSLTSRRAASRAADFSAGLRDWIFLICTATEKQRRTMESRS